MKWGVFTTSFKNTHTILKLKTDLKQVPGICYSDYVFS